MIETKFIPKREIIVNTFSGSITTSDISILRNKLYTILNQKNIDSNLLIMINYFLPNTKILELNTIKEIYTIHVKNSKKFLYVYFVGHSGVVKTYLSMLINEDLNMSRFIVNKDLDFFSRFLNINLNNI